MEKSKKSNINVDYPDVAKECQKRGLIPVLFFEAANANLVKTLRASQAMRRGMLGELVLCSREVPALVGAVPKFDCFVCAQNGEDAFRLFRRRLSVQKGVKEMLANKFCNSPMYCIEINGALLSPYELPVARIHNITRSECARVENSLNAKLTKFQLSQGRLQVCAGNKQDARVILGLNGHNLDLSDIDGVKKGSFGAISQVCARKYDVELLDDRGGHDAQNISRYLGVQARRTFAQNKMTGMLREGGSAVPAASASESAESGARDFVQSR